MQKGPRAPAKRLVWIAIGIWVVAWVGASVIDVVVDHEGDLFERLFPYDDASQVWVRLFLLASLLGFSTYVRSLFDKLSQSQETIRKSEERYRNLFEHANDSIFIADPSNHLLLDLNGHAAERLGYAREELLQLAIDDLVAPESAVFQESNLRGVWEGRTILLEVDLICKDGTAVPVEFSCLSIEYGEKQAVQIFARDITDRKKMEEQVSRAQRLEMAARIAGQVAHDFNNLLSPLVGYPELIKMELPEGHEATRYCDIMIGAAQRMADMNDDLLTLSRRGHVNFEPVDLNRLIEHSLAQLASEPDSLVLELDLAEDILPVRGSQAQISRVFLNLVSNAREAVEDAGRVKITTENVYIDRPFGRYSQVEIGEYVKLQVSDDGPGIPYEIRDKIFDPFFSTKRVARRAGTGLGLSIVHVIVEDHNGYLDLETEQGRGTTFSIFLPTERQTVNPDQNDESLGGTESVLIVDDDQTQRDLLKLLLTTLGYQATSVSSGEEAVACLREQPFDLVILDMIIPPGIDGAETYRQMIAERPGQKAIIISGFAETERVKLAQALGAGAFIRKPVSIPVLSRTVREELGRTRLATS